MEKNHIEEIKNKILKYIELQKKPCSFQYYKKDFDGQNLFTKAELSNYTRIAHCLRLLQKENKIVKIKQHHKPVLYYINNGTIDLKTLDFYQDNIKYLLFEYIKKNQPCRIAYSVNGDSGLNSILLNKKLTSFVNCTSGQIIYEKINLLLKEEKIALIKRDGICLYKINENETIKKEDEQSMEINNNLNFTKEENTELYDLILNEVSIQFEERLKQENEKIIPIFNKLNQKISDLEEENKDLKNNLDIVKNNSTTTTYKQEETINSLKSELNIARNNVALLNKRVEELNKELFHYKHAEVKKDVQNRVKARIGDMFITQPFEIKIDGNGKTITVKK